MADITPTAPATVAAPAPGSGALAPTPACARGHRKERVGEVISNRMAKTIIVRVERRVPAPQIQKGCHWLQEILRPRRDGQAKVGDRVRIEERPAPLQDQCWPGWPWSNSGRR